MCKFVSLLLVPILTVAATAAPGAVTPAPAPAVHTAAATFNGRGTYGFSTLDEAQQFYMANASKL